MEMQITNLILRKSYSEQEQFCSLTLLIPLKNAKSSSLYLFLDVGIWKQNRLFKLKQWYIVVLHNTT